MKDKTGEATDEDDATCQISAIFILLSRLSPSSLLSFAFGILWPKIDRSIWSDSASENNQR